LQWTSRPIGWGKSRHRWTMFGLSADTRSVTTPLFAGISSIKGRFLNVIFYIQNFANSWFTRRYRNEASMLGVLYQYAYEDCVCSASILAYNHYNTHWRGLAKLLISVDRQCEGLGCGISEEVSPTSFLCPYLS